MVFVLSCGVLSSILQIWCLFLSHVLHIFRDSLFSPSVMSLKACQFSAICFLYFVWSGFVPVVPSLVEYMGVSCAFCVFFSSVIGMCCLAAVNHFLDSKMSGPHLRSLLSLFGLCLCRRILSQITYYLTPLQLF